MTRFQSRNSVCLPWPVRYSFVWTAGWLIESRSSSSRFALIHPGSSMDQLESDILPFPLNDELSSCETEKLELSLRNYEAETNCVKTDAQILEHFDGMESESIVTSVNLGLTKTALVSVSPCDLTSFITWSTSSLRKSKPFQVVDRRLRLICLYAFFLRNLIFLLSWGAALKLFGIMFILVLKLLLIWLVYVVTPQTKGFGGMKSFKFLKVKFLHNPILHYAFSSWIEKTMTKTIHFHWEKRFVLQ